MTEHAEIPQTSEPALEADRKLAWFVIHTYSGYEKKVKQNLEARTQSIGHMFNAAVLAGMRVRSVFFEGGSYTDAGMVDTIGSLVLKNEAQTETKIEQGPK